MWLDTNNNGFIDNDEIGRNGVVVELYRDSNGDGVFTPGVDTFVATSATVNGGYYTFSGLTQGGYVVLVAGPRTSRGPAHWRAT